jgi:hypothetical protein
MSASQKIGSLPFTAEIIEATAGVFLSPGYDTPQPTPQFHRDCWERYASTHPACATAAPRNHAKSSALTHDFIVSAAVWRFQEYIILVGATEEMAIEHLGEIAKEFKENEALISHFCIKGFVVDQRTDIIVEFQDGHQFRIIARGAEQKIRGRKWRGKRPGLIVFDDIEDDEQVSSRDRRIKFRRWFFRACKQALRDGGLIRGHGTILHEDSLLSRLMRNNSWDTVIYKAHEGYDDFSNILWPEKFPEERLRAIRQEFENEGDSAGYSQEYLNDPFDSDDAFLKKEQFLEMTEADYVSFKQRAVGVDFAISKADAANRTCFAVVGKDFEDRFIHEDVRVDRMGTLEIVEEFFSVNAAWHPLAFFVENGQIWKAVQPVLDAEMIKRDIYFPYTAITPIKDKKVRGFSYQKNMKARKCHFDKRADWYPGFEAENLRFTGNGEAILDDQFDAPALAHRGMEGWNVQEGDDQTDEEREFNRESEELRGGGGRSTQTGY